MNLPPIILASASPRRAELLDFLGVDFEVVPADVEETEDERLSPEEICLLNAGMKARAVAKEHPDRIVLGADTVVCLGTAVYGKPASVEAARLTLEALQGSAHSVITGLCLVCLGENRERVFSETTRVTFRELSAGQIDRYLEKIEPLDKAGAYAIQDHGEMIVEELAGSFTNVIGLPLGRLRKELERWAND